MFGKHAFRRSLLSKGKDARRSVINIALFDVRAVLLASYDKPFIEAHAKQLRMIIRGLLANWVNRKWAVFWRILRLPECR